MASLFSYSLSDGKIPKHKCCEFNVTMRLFLCVWGEKTNLKGLRGSSLFPFF